MSYRIEYVGCTDKYEVRKKKPRSVPVILFCGTVFFIFACAAIYPEVFRMLRSFLIPGEDAVTVLAFETLTSDLRSGAGIKEAIFDFCRTVIHGT